MHVAVNIMTDKNQHFRVRFGEGVIKEYSLYTFINVDNCERPPYENKFTIKTCAHQIFAILMFNELVKMWIVLIISAE